MRLYRYGNLLLIGWLAALACGCTASKPAAPDDTTQSAIRQVELMETPAGVDPAVYDMLRSELIRLLSERGGRKTVSTPPKGAENVVTDLAVVDAGGGAVELTWTHLCVGDYDANGEVGAPDIQPIAAYFQAKTGDANWAAASVADGDGNGEVNSADIVPIAQYFGVTVQAYAIYSSADPADYPAGPDDVNGAGTTAGDIVQFSSATAVNGRKTFSYTVAAHVAGDAYWVKPFDSSGTRGARSNRAELGAPGATLDMAIHLASPNQPTGGSGTLLDPFTVERLLFYQLQLMHSIDGDVTSHAQAAITSPDPAVSIDPAGVMGVGGLAGGFTVTGAYGGLSVTIVFQAQGATGQVTLGMHPNTPPLAGLGTQADPFEVDDVGIYNLQVVDIAQSQDVTDQAVFTVSDPLVQVDFTGSLVIDPAFSGAFSVDATYNANPTSPGTLYFNATTANQAPTASYDYVGGNTGAVPFDVVFDASGSFDPDGAIVSYEWDINRDGTFDYTSPTPLMEYSYTNLSTFSPVLRVTDNGGKTGEFSHADNVNTTESLSWSTGNISLRGLNDCVIANLDGVPNVAITGNNYVDYLRGTDSAGASFHRYEGLDNQAGFQGHWAVALDSDLGNEQLVYVPTDSNFIPAITNMRYLRCNNGDGSDWPLAGTTVEFHGYQPDVEMQTVDAGINVYFLNEFQHLMMYRSENGGATWDAYQERVESDFSAAPDFSVTDLNNPIIAYAAATDRRLYFRRAGNVTGTSWPGSGSTIDDFAVASNVQLAVANGVPCVAYVDISDMGNQHTPLYFCYARDEQASSWVAPIEITDLHWTTTRGIALAIIKNKPALAYWKGDDRWINYVRANDKQGSWWGKPDSVASPVDLYALSMCEVDFWPHLAYTISYDGGATSGGTWHSNQHWF